MKRIVVALLLLLLLVLVACSKKTAPKPEPVPTAWPAITTSTKDAGASAAIRDLLRDSTAEVAVSSNVDNPKDFPEHLIDGKQETAWNSKTGDLHGWISFEVSKDSHVTQILMTVGFDKKAADGGDLFTMNHRIKKVRVSRAGQAIGDFTLDTEKRGPQTIPIDKPGGVFKVEVLETVPGTKEKWKELVVSEFGVRGRLDPKAIDFKGKHRPDVRVGALKGIKLTQENRLQVRALLDSASPQAFCAAHVAHWKPLNDAHNEYPGPLPTACSAHASVMKGAPIAPFTDAIVLERDEDSAHLLSIAFQVDGKTWHFNGPTLFQDSNADPHCSWYGELYEPSVGVTFHSTDAGPVALVQWHTGDDNHMFMTDEDGGGAHVIHSVVTFWAAVCRKTAAGLSCDKDVEVDARREDLPLESFKTWRSTKQVKVKKDGTLDF
jgi:hypothetical protein